MHAVVRRIQLPFLGICRMWRSRYHVALGSQPCRLSLTSTMRNRPVFPFRVMNESDKDRAARSRPAACER